MRCLDPHGPGNEANAPKSFENRRHHCGGVSLETIRWWRGDLVVLAPWPGWGNVSSDTLRAGAGRPATEGCRKALYGIIITMKLAVVVGHL